MLLHLAIGDAYGAGFEYAPNKIVELHGNSLLYRQHRKYADIGNGRYTDDTQMSLAVAEALLEGDHFNFSSIADRFVKVFKRDERTGYAGGFYKLLTSVENGEQMLDQLMIHGNNSPKSGGAMRASVIGLLPDPNEVWGKATIQASITHNHPLGLAAAAASALMVHYFRHVSDDPSSTGAVPRGLRPHRG
jgi:ADP-ribosyl-[dinitrogen reductase] hydrolase